MSSKMSEQSKARGKGRPRGFDEEQALDAAMMTFWRRGYRNTSLDDLVAATGASRASLYQVFGDKRALFLKSLDLYGDRFSERVAQVMASEPDGRKALSIVLNASADRLVSAEAPAGCLRCNSTLELMGSDAEIDAALNEANDKFLANIKRLVTRSVRNGELNRTEAGRLPLFITAMVNGMVTLARGGARRSDLKKVVDQTLDNWPSRTDESSRPQTRS